MHFTQFEKKKDKKEKKKKNRKKKKKLAHSQAFVPNISFRCDSLFFLSIVFAMNSSSVRLAAQHEVNGAPNLVDATTLIETGSGRTMLDSKNFLFFQYIRCTQVFTVDS